MIRRYTESDARRCCEIINGCLPQFTEMNEPARDYIRAKNIPSKLHIDLDSFFTVVFVENDTIVALGALADSEIKRVYVEPTAQDRGIGRTIVEWLEGVAIRRGLEEVQIRAQPNAVAFYARLGYRVLGRQQFVVDRCKFTIVCMEKSLQPHDAS